MLFKYRAGIRGGYEPGITRQISCFYARFRVHKRFAPGFDLIVGQADGERTGGNVDIYDVAVLYQSDEAARKRFGADMPY